MKNFGKVKSSTRPPKIETTDTMVFVASNIEPYSFSIDNYEINGYEYDYIGYTKDEYIQKISSENSRAIAELEEELKAAKILLGVE